MTLVSCSVCQAVLIRSGNGNTTAPPDDPGFASIGLSSTGNASVTYLGNRWVLTANHNTTGTKVTFGGTDYTIDLSTVQRIDTTDLKVFRITTDPGINGVNIATSAPAPGDEVVQIGNGLSRGASERYWDITGVFPAFVWTEVFSPATADAGGYSVVSPRQIRWGKNNVFTNNQFFNFGGATGTVNYFTTMFDDASIQYGTGVTPLADEALSTNGDSGGGVFQKIGSNWFLTGLMFSETILEDQPGSTAVYGDQSYIVQLANYRTEIMAIIPEPSSGLLAWVGGALLAGIARRRARKEHDGAAQS